MKETLSFIVIAYNEERNIVNCLNSISALKKPTDIEYEIIVVNDGSKDRTLEILRECAKKNDKIKIISSESNNGRGFARHAGVVNSKSDLIAFVDADIILPEDWLLKSYAQLKEFDMVGGIATPDTDMSYLCRKFGLNQKIRPHTSGITGSNSLIKRRVFEKYGFDEHLRDGEDTDLVWKAQANHVKIKLVTDLIVKHDDNPTYFSLIQRFFSFGKYANILLYRYKKIRFPDLGFASFIILLLINVLVRNIDFAILSILLFFWILGLAHLILKIQVSFHNLFNIFLASIFLALPIFAYNVGRIVGLIFLFGDRRIS